MFIINILVAIMSRSWTSQTHLFVIFTRAMEEFIKHCPAHVFDKRSDNGFTPMLTATEKGHGDIVALLAQMVSIIL